MIDTVHQAIQIQWLGQHIVEPCGPGRRDFLFQDPGRQADNGQVVQSELLPNQACRGQTIHHRHLDIHEDDVHLIGPCFQEVDGELAINFFKSLGPLRLRQIGDQIPIDGTVIDDQAA